MRNWAKAMAFIRNWKKFSNRRVLYKKPNQHRPKTMLVFHRQVGQNQIPIFSLIKNPIFPIEAISLSKRRSAFNFLTKNICPSLSMPFRKNMTGVFWFLDRFLEDLTISVPETTGRSNPQSIKSKGWWRAAKSPSRPLSVVCTCHPPKRNFSLMLSRNNFCRWIIRTFIYLNQNTRMFRSKVLNWSTREHTTKVVFWWTVMWIFKHVCRLN